MTATIEKARKYDYSDVMVWLGILIMVLWVIGKLSGMI
jgi:hypothetical protein